MCATLLVVLTTAISGQTPAGQAAPRVGSDQSGVAGTWRSEDALSCGGNCWWMVGWTLVVERDGATLIGAVTNCPRAGAVEIFDGQIDAETLRFKCRSPDGNSTMSFIGRLDKGEIVLRWERQDSQDLQERKGRPAPTPGFGPVPGGPPDPPQFTVKRVSDAAGQMVLARVAERVRTTRPPFSPVTFERILEANREPQNWLTYSGTMLGHRHSLLAQITPENVAGLDLAWIWASQSTGSFEATPLVADGVLYTVQAPNDVVALDAISGAVLWTLPYTPAAGARATGGGGRPNRGLAILGDRLFLGTLDAHLLAIDARTGKLLWNTTVADAADPACKPPNRPGTVCYVITHAPLAVKDKVIVGTGGGDGDAPGFGIRGLIAAFDVTTGEEVWRFHTIPAAGEPGNDTWSGDSWKTGGAGVWQTGAYDPDLNLTYWGTGNPVPTSDGSTRLGDNLYSNSVVALDADTGALKWHYQFTPHDEMDWDSAHVPVLTDIDWQGRARKVMLVANKNGLMYVLDRVTGQFLMGKPFVELNWMDRFDERGRPVLSSTAKSDWLPGRASGTNWHPPSFSPTTGLFYIPSRERKGAGPGNAFGAVRAFDPRTGDRKWEFVRNDAWFTSGVLTTSSGLLFSGTTGDIYSGPVAARLSDGYLYALDARTGAQLWRTSLAGSVQGSPITYAAGGTQYVVVSAGNFLFAFALRQ
jgi:alcohol dehydrogenase (cytochrome c)